MECRLHSRNYSFHQGMQPPSQKIHQRRGTHVFQFNSSFQNKNQKDLFDSTEVQMKEKSVHSSKNILFDLKKKLSFEECLKAKREFDYNKYMNIFKTSCFNLKDHFENHVSQLEEIEPVIDIPLMNYSPKSSAKSYWKFLADSLLNPYTSQSLIKKVIKNIKEYNQLDKALKHSFTHGKMLNLEELTELGANLAESQKPKKKERKYSRRRNRTFRHSRKDSTSMHSSRKSNDESTFSFRSNAGLNPPLGFQSRKIPIGNISESPENKKIKKVKQIRNIVITRKTGALRNSSTYESINLLPYQPLEDDSEINISMNHPQNKNEQIKKKTENIRYRPATANFSKKFIINPPKQSTQFFSKKISQGNTQLKNPMTELFQSKQYQQENINLSRKLKINRSFMMNHLKKLQASPIKLSNSLKRNIPQVQIFNSSNEKSQEKKIFPTNRFQLNKSRQQFQDAQSFTQAKSIYCQESKSNHSFKKHRRSCSKSEENKAQKASNHKKASKSIFLLNKQFMDNYFKARLIDDDEEKYKQYFNLRKSSYQETTKKNECPNTQLEEKKTIHQNHEKIQELKNLLSRMEKWQNRFEKKPNDSRDFYKNEEILKKHHSSSKTSEDLRCSFYI